MTGLIASLGLPSTAYAQDAPRTESISILHSFLPPAPGEDARTPYAPPLLVLEDHLLYGVGSAGPAASFRGAVFRTSLNGDFYDLIYAFATTDVRAPNMGLILGSDGMLYGTAPSGGPVRGNAGGVFRFNRDGTGFQTLHVFTNSPDGAGPSGPVMEGPGGFLFGVTGRGGSIGGGGTVYKLSKDGSLYTVIQSFNSTSGGPAGPSQSLLLGSDGMLYGTSVEGGTNGVGSVYRLAIDGTAFQLLKSFSNRQADADGQSPNGPLIAQGDELIGTTSGGGTKNAGTLYRLKGDGGQYRVVHRFAGGPTEGANPYGNLVTGLDGKLYGTTLNGGSGSVGTIYRFEADGTSFEVLRHIQRDKGEPQLPQSGLVASASGEFYGTSTGGGDTGFGTVFRFHPPVRYTVSPRLGEWILEWVANGIDYRAQQTERLEANTVWTDVVTALEVDGRFRRLRIAAPNSDRFIRLFAD
jgi:uncharacterized repeat protein (TIGR03803 family)